MKQRLKKVTSILVALALVVVSAATYPVNDVSAAVSTLYIEEGETATVSLSKTGLSVSDHSASERNNFSASISGKTLIIQALSTQSANGSDANMSTGSIDIIDSSSGVERTVQVNVYKSTSKQTFKVNSSLGNNDLYVCTNLTNNASNNKNVYMYDGNSTVLKLSQYLTSNNGTNYSFPGNATTTVTSSDTSVISVSGSGDSWILNGRNTGSYYNVSSEIVVSRTWTSSAGMKHGWEYKFKVYVYKQPALNIYMDTKDNIITANSINLDNNTHTFDYYIGGAPSTVDCTFTCEAGDSSKLKVEGSRPIKLVPLTSLLTTPAVVTFKVAINDEVAKANGVEGSTLTRTFSVYGNKDSSENNGYTRLSFDFDKMDIPVGSSKMIKANYYPVDATMTSVKYSSSDPYVVSVDENTGLVTGLKLGKATITASSPTDPSINASFDATVTLPAANNVKAENGSNGNKLSWSPVEGATAYDIYRADSENGYYGKIASTTETSYTDTTAKVGSTCFYKIVSVYGRNTDYNSDLSSATKCTRGLSIPYITGVVKNGTSYVIKIGGVKYTGYEIYQIVGSERRLLTKTTNTSSALKFSPNKLYILSVRSYHTVGNVTSYSNFSPNFHLTIGADGSVGGKIIKVNAPSKLKIKKISNKKIRASWKKAKNVTGYRVKYSLRKGFSKATIVHTKKTKITIKKLKPGKTYWVKVCAYKKVGKRKYFSKYTKKIKVKMKK